MDSMIKRGFIGISLTSFLEKNITVAHANKLNKTSAPIMIETTSMIFHLPYNSIERFIEIKQQIITSIETSLKVLLKIFLIWFLILFEFFKYKYQVTFRFEFRILIREDLLDGVDVYFRIAVW